MGNIKLAIFDVAGTTAKDDGLVVQAFQDAISASGFSSQEVEKMTEYVKATMGQRKIDVFTYLCDGNVSRVESMHEDFVSAYNSIVQHGFLEEFEGISHFFRELGACGVGIGITTGFPREILDPILSGLAWNDLIDVSVAASEVAQGRPAPDMVLRSVEIFNKMNESQISVNEVAVIGDTPSDVASGLSAQAGLVIAVTSGAFERTQLETLGADYVLNFATDAFELLTE